MACCHEDQTAHLRLHRTLCCSSHTILLRTTNPVNPMHVANAAGLRPNEQATQPGCCHNAISIISGAPLAKPPHAAVSPPEDHPEAAPHTYRTDRQPCCYQPTKRKWTKVQHQSTTHTYTGKMSQCWVHAQLPHHRVVQHLRPERACPQETAVKQGEAFAEHDYAYQALQYRAPAVGRTPSAEQRL